MQVILDYIREAWLYHEGIKIDIFLTWKGWIGTIFIISYNLSRMKKKEACNLLIIEELLRWIWST